MFEPCRPIMHTLEGAQNMWIDEYSPLLSDPEGLGIKILGLLDKGAVVIAVVYGVWGDEDDE